MKTCTLYRPMGHAEWELVVASGMKHFPPRLYWQPIFYPVLNLAYAEQIAREWNVHDEAGGYTGYVVAFDLPQSYIDQFPVQQVGGELHQELWIPAEQLDEFNSRIIGPIRHISTFFGDKHKKNG